MVDDGGGEEFRHAVSPIPHGALKLVADVVKVLLHALMVALAEVAQGTIVADTWQSGSVLNWVIYLSMLMTDPSQPRAARSQLKWALRWQGMAKG